MAGENENPIDPEYPHGGVEPLFALSAQAFVEAYAKMAGRGLRAITTPDGMTTMPIMLTSTEAILAANVLANAELPYFDTSAAFNLTPDSLNSHVRGVAAILRWFSPNESYLKAYHATPDDKKLSLLVTAARRDELAQIGLKNAKLVSFLAANIPTQELLAWGYSDISKPLEHYAAYARLVREPRFGEISANLAAEMESALTAGLHKRIKELEAIKIAKWGNANTWDNEVDPMIINLTNALDAANDERVKAFTDALSMSIYNFFLFNNLYPQGEAREIVLHRLGINYSRETEKGRIDIKLPYISFEHIAAVFSVTDSTENVNMSLDQLQQNGMDFLVNILGSSLTNYLAQNDGIITGSMLRALFCDRIALVVARLYSNLNAIPQHLTK